ncbi:hypothetical protein V6N13_092585 [Hibiscus sabdariffa]
MCFSYKFSIIGTLYGFHCLHYEQVKRVVRFVDRHNFVNLRRSVVLIQQAAGIYIAQRRDASRWKLVEAAIVIQKYVQEQVRRLLYSFRDLEEDLFEPKRNPRTAALKESTDRRLKVAVQLLKLITNGCRIQ